MGAKNIEIDPNWRHAGKLLSVDEVCLITGFGYFTILRLRKSGTLVASLHKRPYRFDPEHIYQVFFSTQKLVLSDSVSSLKTEKKVSVGRKPLTLEELWQKR